jgi:hypothetical protein
MNTDAFQLTVFLSQLATYVPTILVCLVAGIVVIARWRDIPGAAPYALLGFGLLFVLCFVIPLGNMMLQHWVLEEGQRASRMWAFTVFGFANGALHALIYILLLFAIFAGRPKTGGV